MDIRMTTTVAGMIRGADILFREGETYTIVDLDEIAVLLDGGYGVEAGQPQADPQPRKKRTKPATGGEEG